MIVHNAAYTPRAYARPPRKPPGAPENASDPALKWVGAGMTALGSLYTAHSFLTATSLAELEPVPGMVAIGMTLGGLCLAGRDAFKHDRLDAPTAVAALTMGTGAIASGIGLMILANGL